MSRYTFLVAGTGILFGLIAMCGCTPGKPEARRIAESFKDDPEGGFEYLIEQLVIKLNEREGVPGRFEVVETSFDAAKSTPRLTIGVAELKYLSNESVNGQPEFTYTFRIELQNSGDSWFGEKEGFKNYDWETPGRSLESDEWNVLVNKHVHSPLADPYVVFTNDVDMLNLSLMPIPKS